MGLLHSKKNRQSATSLSTTTNRSNDFGRNSQLTIDIISPYDRSIIDELHKMLIHDPDLFILNHLLMSTMFFENFENEVWNKPKSTTAFEKDMNPTLMKDYYKRCFMPDIHFQNVNRHVRFQPKHGPKKNESEPLIPERMYIIHDNIEVIDTCDPQYNNIDKPSIKIEIEKAKHSGYVKLKKINGEEFKNCSNETISQLDKPSTSGCNVLNSKEISSNSSIISSSDEPDKNVEEKSDVNDSSDYYDYTTISDIRTPKFLDIATTQNLPPRLSDIPYNCFTGIRTQNLPHSDSEDGESDEDVDKDVDEDVDEDIEEDFDTRIRKQNLLEMMRKQEEENEHKLYIIIYYINSSEFMKFFQNHVFPNYLGPKLNFKEEDIKKSKTLPGIIFCNSYDGNDLSTNCEIIPAVSVKPNLLPSQWLLKIRPEKVGSDKQIYQWPTANMIQEVVQYESLMVPAGFVPKRGENKENFLEWEMAFPQVEKYLGSKMTHAQMKGYLTLVVLFKTHIEPHTDKKGLLIDHLRTLMYLECEANYRDWPDHRLGDRLLMVLKKLKYYLGLRHLPDYFIADKNLFVNIPGRLLIKCQKQIHDILESPTMYFLAALRNLRYTNQNSFYPYPDYTKLYKILTDRTVLTINVGLQDAMEEEQVRTIRKYQYNAQQKWKYEKLKQSRKKKQATVKKAPVETKRKRSTDSIDLEFTCSGKIDNFRIISILTFFIEHFLEVALASRKIASSKQVMLYLKYAWYLTKILETISTHREEAKKYQEKIAKEEVYFARASIMELTGPPATPKRNSFHHFNDQLIGTTTLRQDQLNEKPSRISSQLTNVFNKSNANRTKTKSVEFKKVLINDAVEIVE